MSLSGYSVVEVSSKTQDNNMKKPLTTVCVLLTILIALCFANDNSSSKPRGNKVSSLAPLLSLLFSNSSQYFLSFLLEGFGGRGSFISKTQNARQVFLNKKRT